MKIISLTLAALLASISFVSSDAASCNAQQEANKKAAVALLNGVFNNRDTSVVDQYVGDEYLQHNPTAGDGKDSLKAVLAYFSNETKVEFGAVAAEGDLVWVNTRYSGFRPTPNVALDVMRFENGKIVEHWDIQQVETPADKTASGRPMFPIESALKSDNNAKARACDSDSSAPCPAEPKLESNKKSAVALLDGVFNQRDSSVVDLYIGEEYLQHNPGGADRKDSLKSMVAYFSNETKVEFGAVAAEGDLVWVNTRYSGFGPTPNVALDVMRFENGKIVEHWDIQQAETPADKTVSSRPMFPIKA